MKLTEDEWRLKSYKYTVFGVPIALISLVIIVGALGFTILQLQSGIDTTNNLAELIYTNQEQTKALQEQTKVLQETIEEIQHQTLMEAFTDGGGYNFNVYRCSSINPQPDKDGNDVYSMSYFPVILDREGDPTPIPFYIYLTFYFWYDYHQNGSGKDVLDTQRVSQYLLVPSDRNALHLDFTEAIKNAEEKNYSNIRVILSGHSFAPYSPVKDKLLSEYFDTNEDSVFTEIRLLGDEWDANHPEGSICANSLDK